MQFHMLPFKTWNSDKLWGKNRVKTKTGTKSCQQTGAQRPHRGAVGHHLRRRTVWGKAQESKANGQREVAPGLSAAAGLAALPSALGEPSATVLMNVNEDGGDFR